MYFCLILALMFVGDCVLSGTCKDQNQEDCEKALECENCCEPVTYEQKDCKLICKCGEKKTKTIPVADLKPIGEDTVCYRGCLRKIYIQEKYDLLICKQTILLLGVKSNCTQECKPKNCTQECEPKDCTQECEPKNCTCEPKNCTVDIYVTETGKYLGTSKCLLNGTDCTVDGHKGTCNQGECVCAKDTTDDKQAPSSKGAPKLNDAKSDPKSNTDKSAEGLNDEEAPRAQPAKRGHLQRDELRSNEGLDSQA